MMWFIIFVVLAICFGGVLLVGAPYLPTLSPQVAVALQLAEFRKGQTLLELGCGDGKVAIAAARQGYKVIGYELNPLLALIAWLRTRRYRRQVRIIWGDFWHVTWPQADVIFTFLLPKYMKKLDTKIIQYPHKPVKLISYAFTVPGRQPVRERSGIYRYDYR